MSISFIFSSSKLTSKPWIEPLGAGSLFNFSKIYSFTLLLQYTVNINPLDKFTNIQWIQFCSAYDFKQLISNRKSVKSKKYKDYI